MRYLRQLAVFLILLLACLVLLWFVYSDIEAKTIARVDSEQMVHADQAAAGINRFFTTYNGSLSFLAGDRHIIAMDPDGRRMVREFYRTHADEIASVTRVDENGTILYTYPFESSTGSDISGQSHVRQELATRQLVTSEVFLSVQGFRTVAMHVPVFDNSTYRGSIAILIPFDTLAGRNVGPIRILDNGYGWVVSRRSGTILYSPVAGQTGLQAADVYADSLDAGPFLALAQATESGTASYTTGTGRADGRTVTYEAVYRRAGIGDPGWTIVVATPRDEILATLRDLQRNLVIICLVLFLSLAFFTYSITRARAIVREEEERRAAGEALRESEEKYRSIIANLQDAYYRADREGRIVMVSPSTVRLLGAVSAEDLVGRFAAGFYFANGERDRMMEAVRTRGSVTNYEARLKRTDGTVITGLFNSHVLTDRDGNFDGVEGIIRDITDRKRTENALAQATKKLNLLTAITLNDIRNTLFALSGYLELETGQTAEGTREEFHCKEKALLQKIDHYLTIAKNYQSLGISPPRLHTVSTTFVLALSHLGPTQVRHDIRVGNLEIYADPLLEVVFQNLAQNVLDHAHGATLITLRYELTPAGLALFFEDNGPGIPPDRKEAIFGRGAVTCTGNGLFMVREILEITGITISETGEYGSGARFRMDIPREGFRFTDEGTGP